MIDRFIIKHLAASSDPWAASLYLPKVEAGQKYAYDPDALERLSGRLVQLMEARGRSSAEQVVFRERLEDLCSRDHFYNRYQPGMLALFVSPSRQEAVDFPERIDEIVYLGEEFYLRPIVSLLNDLERFLLLVLGPHRALLYEGTSRSLVQSANLTPFSADEGKPQKLGTVNLPEGAEVPADINAYLRKVDENLASALDQEDIPLILSGQPGLCAAYREVSSHGRILPKAIPFPQDPEDRESLLEQVRPILEDHLRERKAAKRRAFIQEMLKGNASISLTDILAAAVNGEVSNLYLDRDEHSRGIFKPAIAHARVGAKGETGDTALFNLAAIRTFMKDGTVYDLAREDLPDSTTAINATFKGGSDTDILGI